MRFYPIILALLFTVKAFNQERHIPFYQEKIDVDASLNEEVWKRIPSITGFHNYMPTDEGLASLQTHVKMFHDGQYLYVSAVYEDNDATIQTSSFKRDASIGLSDAFVLILDTQNQKQNAYYFSVNGYGSQGDGIVERTNEGFSFSTSWNTVWEGSASVDGTNKVYELAIPLKYLNYDKDVGQISIQMYVRDIKKNAWTIMSDLSRNYRLFDLRFTTPFSIDNLPNSFPSKFVFTPSVTGNYLKNKNEEGKFKGQPSLDIQYNINSSLKLDATINPDFSQIDVDQQVTNLTRFGLFFPERRNFFLENADLFSNLGNDDVNPFYSRRIGQRGNIKMGLKLSGNLSPKTRIGVMNVQTHSPEENHQNYGVMVAEQQLSSNFTTTAYVINRQETNRFKLGEDYNRVAGINLNFKSSDFKWTGVANYSKSFNHDVSGKNNYLNLGIWYNQRGFSANVGLKSLGENYITDVGFTPRLYHFDASNNQSVRLGYIQSDAGFEYQRFMEASTWLNSIRVLSYNNKNYFNHLGSLTQSSHFFNSALFFKNLSSIYYVFTYDNIDLEYGFDPLNNGSLIEPGNYRFGHFKVGYNSSNKYNFRYNVSLENGQYYNGQRTAAGVYLSYARLPFARFELSYNANRIDLHELGSDVLHLINFTTEIFINKYLNWTTYTQYNTQSNNFNINSRIQWEYKPLSYLYVVVTDNLDKRFTQKNWGLALKLNYRFEM